MASPHRAILLSSSDLHLRYISTGHGYLMVEDGTAEEMDDAENGMLVFKLRGRGKKLKDSPKKHVVATLTSGDMERNAEAVADHKSCRSRHKVEKWPDVHDTYAVTVVAGRGIFRPEPMAAAKRAKQIRKKKSCGR